MHENISVADKPLSLDAEHALGLRRRVVIIITGLLCANVFALVLLLIGCQRYPAMGSPGILAFTLGLRHAVDADHIASIDNVTRKFVQEGKGFLSVGLWFSIGHSSVVCLLSLAVAVGSSVVRQHLQAAENAGAIIGTTVSATVLFIIGFVNLCTARQLLAGRRSAQESAQECDTEFVSLDYHHHHLHPEDGNGFEQQHEGHHSHTHVVSVSVNAEVTGPGILANCCPGLFKFVDSPQHMCPIGFLFGLGFDTASEVGLLALAVLGSKEGIPALWILVLPLLFSSGMALIDTLDGMLMLWAYGWAAVDPAKTFYFNLFLTASSALIALFIGLIETLGCFQEQFQLTNPFWDFVASMNNSSEFVGYSIIAFFVISSIVALACYQYAAR
mmetsp:Transcript_76648/g.135729  ORF Transcript_76648/g.135729 Transcript_76648/m.135729 type:complete len:387 (+) Transcript_76648:29-1189(+)